MIMEGVRAHWENYPVTLQETPHDNEWYPGLGGRLAVIARNEGGYCSTGIDLVDLVEWVKKHMPELLK